MLVFACIAPHGGVSIESLGNPHADRATGTRAAMAELRKRAREAGVDAWIVMGPHGLKVAGTIALSDGDRAISHIEPEGPTGEAFHFEVPVHRELSQFLAERSNARGVPATRVVDGLGHYPMDWSGSIPLSFLGANDATPVVQAVPSRDLGWSGMIHFGEVVAEVVKERSERIGFVASSDLGHAHDPEGPYGFDPASAVYDRMCREAIEASDPMRLASFDPKLVESAKVDGQWQILVLAGLFQTCPLELDFLSYEVPTYFGMLTAGSRVDGSLPGRSS